ncbi:B3 domain-containing protein Os11g0197600-like [Argentina anserina]|uniref:B3 domain-containing protein Os11g0197600-like n=1 Tax=Argentina anserina TaxID=57926 RepID=UPI00217689E8|nr:B3 domain-containing protein Os11g0197600-like [Potentilla anserina]
MATRASTSLPFHGGVKEEEGPTFFKIIRPGFNMEHIRIPPAFRTHVSPELSERAILKLKNSSESSWTVRVTTSGRDIYLKDGWQEFLRDNSLGDSEFLVFRYVKSMCFIINVFDKDCVERVHFPKARTSQASTFQKKTKRPSGRSQTAAGNLPHNFAAEAARVLTFKAAQLPNSAAAAAFKSKFPYFMKVLGESRMVAIPTDFYRKMFCLGKFDEVFLVTSKGKFTVTLYPCSDTMMLSGGWVSFRDGNRLQVDDICIFELLNENTMRVHIFRN